MNRAGLGINRILRSPSSTMFVAANDALSLSKFYADYVCDGTGDEVEINAALAALPT